MISMRHINGREKEQKFQIHAKFHIFLSLSVCILGWFFISSVRLMLRLKIPFASIHIEWTWYSFLCINQIFIMMAIDLLSS